MGLKADYSPNRNFAAKGYIPKDWDGAYRVANRLDGLEKARVYTLAEERRVRIARVYTLAEERKNG